MSECEAGCLKVTGGEVKHDKNCVFYPESYTKIRDNLEQQLKDCQSELENMTYRAKDYYDMIMKIPEKELQKHGIIVITTGETLKGELNNDTINSKRFHECGN